MPNSSNMQYTIFRISEHRFKYMYVAGSNAVYLS